MTDAEEMLRFIRSMQHLLDEEADDAAIAKHSRLLHEEAHRE